MIFRKKVIVIILIVSITIFSFIILLFVINFNKNKIFTETILNLDSLIVSGSYQKADDLLIKALNNVNSSLDFKQLLKRAYQIGNFKNLILISEKGHNKYTKNKDILSIYIFSLLKTGNIKKAQDIIKNFKNNIIPENLYKETEIKSGEYYNTENIYYRVIHETNISLYKKLFNITENNKLLIDIVLMYMGNGDFKKANDVLSSLESDMINKSKLFFLTKYYSYQYNAALDLLLLNDYGFSIEDLSLIKIDLNLKMSLYPDAVKNITNFLNLYPEYSVLPYVNLIYLGYFTEIQNIGKFINSSINYFPDNRKLILSLIDYFILNNSENKAIKLVENYFKNNVNDDEFKIFLKQLKGTENPEIFTNSLYNLVNQKKDNLNYSRFLAWSLFKDNNMPELEKYLASYDDDLDIPWIYFFKGLIAVNKSDKSLAINNFKNAFKLEVNWETLYNIGLISFYSHDYQKAIEYLQNSENMIPSSVENLEIKSNIRTTLATLMFDMSNYDNSYREIIDALDLNKSNTKASLLLKKLESTNF